MRMIALLAMVLSFNVLAVEFSHTDFGNDGFSRHYYSCDFAEAALEGHLEALGATQIDVSCSGGIESWGVFPVTLQARFDLPNATRENHTRATALRLKASSRFNEACFFHTKLLNKLLKVTSNVEVNSRSAHCVDNRSRWSYSVTVFE